MYNLPEVVSLYILDLIEKTGGSQGPLGLQFIAQPEKEKKYHPNKFIDPYNEKKYEIVPNLIYKFKGKINKKGKITRYGRALWIISKSCATYCRFCMRGRIVGSTNSILTSDGINKVFEFLKRHKEINEVILSGGDPLNTSEEYLTKIINGLVLLQKNGFIEIIRIGTRLPITNPPFIKDWHYNLISNIKNPYLMVHINHPFELTSQSIEVINNFRKKSNAIVLGQTVLLKGVNDSEKILCQLFNKMAKEGIQPYCLYQNDPVPWASHFTVPILKAIKLWQKIRPQLSGIAATARFIIESPHGLGKIPVPEAGAWDVDYSHYYDFNKKKHPLVK